jgi:cell fate (sporulation/competence/biofilm development) regulator YlbF (YheA/YmcA/DUF963 family)
VANCIEMSKALGKEIANSPQAIAYRAASDAIHADAELSKMIEEYERQAGKIADLEDQQKPVEVEDKRRLQELNGRLVSSAQFKKFSAAQMEYINLLRQVNDAMRAELAETEG